MRSRCTDAPGDRGRRSCLRALAAAAVLVSPIVRSRAADAPATVAELRATLDLLAHKRSTLHRAYEFHDALDSLTRFDAARLPPSAAIDLATVRAGLAFDAERANAMSAGDAARVYATCVACAAGERLDTSELRRRLEREVSRLTSQADRHFDYLGLRKGSIGARYRDLATRAGQIADGDAPARAAQVAYLNVWVDRARARLPLWFDAVPAWCLDVHVEQPSAADLAADRAGFRRLPELRADGTVASGAYVIDLHDPTRRPRFTLAAIAPHELLPGHLLQLPLEVAAGAHPLRIEYLSAFSEGWATYAEDLLAANGQYALAREPQERIAAELGAVHWRLFRALRGLLDLELNLNGWGTDRALDRLHNTQGFPVYFAPFDGDIARLRKDPGVRAAEAMVWLRLRELSATAARRGHRRIFHRRALEHGRQPLAGLAA